MENFNLDSESYNELLILLNNQHFTDRPAFKSDLEFLSDDWWLRDTAVIENIVKRDGMWEIQLVFAHHLNPKKLIKRVISRYSSKDKAEMNAWYMKRVAAKDQRGTQKVELSNFGLCLS